MHSIFHIAYMHVCTYAYCISHIACIHIHSESRVAYISIFAYGMHAFDITYCMDWYVHILHAQPAYVHIPHTYYILHITYYIYIQFTYMLHITYHIYIHTYYICMHACTYYIYIHTCTPCSILHIHIHSHRWPDSCARGSSYF